MDIASLRDRYPLVAAAFDESVYADGAPDQLMDDLVSYFRSMEHHVFMSNTPPVPKGSKKVVMYRAILTVHGTVLTGWTTMHTSYADARAEGVMRFLEMFEQHFTQRMRADLCV